MDLALIEAEFEDQGASFKRRRGPAYAGERVPPLNKKLCLTATDKAFLVRLLYELSNLPACFAVKYSHTPKDDMYLGRVFVTDEALLGELWAEYKVHPKLMCSIQDDDAIEVFRQRHHTPSR